MKFELKFTTIDDDNKVKYEDVIHADNLVALAAKFALSMSQIQEKMYNEAVADLKKVFSNADDISF